MSLFHASLISMFDTSILMTVLDIITWAFWPQIVILFENINHRFYDRLSFISQNKKATISFTTSSSTTSSKCTGILKSISMLHQWTNFLGISQTSQSCIDLDKIFLWNSFHQQLVSFFLSEFSFRKICDLQDSKGRVRLFL